MCKVVCGVKEVYGVQGGVRSVRKCMVCGVEGGVWCVRRCMLVYAGVKVCGGVYGRYIDWVFIHFGALCPSIWLIAFNRHDWLQPYYVVVVVVGSGCDDQHLSALVPALDSWHVFLRAGIADLFLGFTCF